MLQKSLIITRSLMASLTVLSIGMIFIATSSVFAKNGDQVHLTLHQVSDAIHCVTVAFKQQDGSWVRFPKVVNFDQKDEDGGTYSVNTLVSLDYYGDSQACIALDRSKALQKDLQRTLDAGTFDPTPNQPTTYEATWDIY